MRNLSEKADVLTNDVATDEVNIAFSLWNRHDALFPSDSPVQNVPEGAIGPIGHAASRTMRVFRLPEGNFDAEFYFKESEISNTGSHVTAAFKENLEAFHSW